MSLFTAILNELKTSLHVVYEQLTYSRQSAKAPPVDTKEIRFTNNFQQKAKGLGLTEADALDVYQHGSTIKENMMVRKYPSSGYELGIYYFIDGRTGQTVITSIWKRERR